METVFSLIRQWFCQRCLNDAITLAYDWCVNWCNVCDVRLQQAFLILGVDSHRYMCWLFEEAARAKGVRLICFDRPGRGYTSDYYEERWDIYSRNIMTDMYSRSRPTSLFHHLTWNQKMMAGIFHLSRRDKFCQSSCKGKDLLVSIYSCWDMPFSPYPCRSSCEITV